MTMTTMVWWGRCDVNVESHSLVRQSLFSLGLSEPMRGRSWLGSVQVTKKNQNQLGSVQGTRSSSFSSEKHITHQSCYKCLLSKPSRSSSGGLEDQGRGLGVSAVKDLSATIVLSMNRSSIDFDRQDRYFGCFVELRAICVPNIYNHLIQLKFRKWVMFSWKSF